MRRSALKKNLARRAPVAKAFAELLAALDVQGTVAPRVRRATPKRAAALWLDALLVGEGRDPGAALGRGMPHPGATPVCVRHIGMHLVCPHHLTVALGRAHVAYLPHGRVAGLGAISDLVRVCTARFILQEEAVQLICEALVSQLQARAAVALLEAVHPCHTLTRPSSHGAHVATFGSAGARAAAPALQRLLLAGRDAFSGRR